MRRSPKKVSGLESDIIKLVRSASGISRVELARTLGLSPSTAGIYVERLIADGFLSETEKATREAGRPPVQLKLNPDGGEFIGIDFEARRIMAAAVDFADTPLRREYTEINAADTATDVIKKIEHTISLILPKKEKRLLAIGVGVPGLVNSAEGVALRYKYISKWKDIPLAGRLSRKFGVPVYLENNVRSMALAEMWFGQGLGVGDFVCVGIRSGIGAGLVLGGGLYSGARHDAGEFGRWRCPLLSERVAAWFANDGATSSPDAPGLELQEIASVRAIQRALQQAIASGEKSVLGKRPATVTLEDILKAIQCRDPLTSLIIGEAARCLGWAIGNLSLIVDPEKIVIAGPLTSLGDALMQPLRATIETVASLSNSRMPDVVYSTMGEFSGALGAAALALHEWRPAR